jgi:hypothetical protein
VFPVKEQPALLSTEEQAVAMKIVGHQPGNKLSGVRLNLMSSEDRVVAETLVKRSLAGYSGRSFYLTCKGLDALQARIGSMHFGNVE